VLKAPREHGLRVGSVACKEPASKVGKLAQFSFTDQLPCVLHHGSPAVVVPNEAKNTSLSGQALDLGGLARILAYGLLAKDMLSGGSSGTPHLQMHVVRRCDIHNLNARVRNHVLPAGCVTLEAKSLLGLLGSFLNFVCANNEFCLDATIVEAIGSGEIRTAVHRPHPAHPDHAHADDLLHTHAPSGFGIMKSRTRPSSSWQAAMN
jgi:hypothetical protein